MNLNPQNTSYTELNTVLTDALEKFEKNQISEEEFDNIVLYVKNKMKEVEIKKKNNHINEVIFKLLR